MKKKYVIGDGPASQHLTETNLGKGPEKHRLEE